LAHTIDRVSSERAFGTLLSRFRYDIITVS